MKLSYLLILQKMAGVKYEIGDVLKLDIGERYSYIAEGEAKVSLGQSSGFRKATDDNEGEKFVAKFTKEYTITGIITRPGFEPYWSPGYTVISYLDKINSHQPILLMYR